MTQQRTEDSTGLSMKANHRRHSLFEDEHDKIVREMNMAHSKRFKKKDIYEIIPLFKDVTNLMDRKMLENALIPERFSKGDVIFNYGDVGDKFFIVMEGEVTMKLPDPDVELGLWKHQYKDYQLLLEDIKQKEEMERKKKLVEKRLEFLKDQ